MRHKIKAYRMYLLFSCLYAGLYSLMSTVTMVYQVDVIHLNPLQLVLTGTVFESACFLGQVPTGMVADLYSRRLSIVIGVALTGLGFLLQGAIPAFWAVMASQLFLGIGSTFTDGAVEAWIADEDGSRSLNRIFLRGAQLGQIGSVAGILLSTALGNLSLTLPILLAGVLMLAFSLFLIALMPENNFHPAAPEDLNSFQKLSFTFRSGMRIIRSKNVLIGLMCMALFGGLASEGYDRLNTDHFLKDTVLPSLWVLKPVTWFGIFGILTMLFSALAMQLVIRKWSSPSGRGSLNGMTLINFLIIVSMLAFGLTRSFGLMLATYLAISTLKALNRPIMNAFLGGHIDGSIRATVLSTNEQMNSLGEILGGPLIGLVAERLSVGIGISSTVIFLIPVLLILFKMRAWEKKPVA